MQRSPILLKKLSKLEAHSGKLVIGILGTHKGAGTTHFGILLSNYMSEWVGKKTAFLECYPQKDIGYLEDYFYDNTQDSEKKDSFKLHRVTYHKSVKDTAIAEIIGGDYECVVMDLGTDFLKNRNEFLRCDRRIVVSSLAIWKKQELVKFINNTCHIKYSSQWIYAIPFALNKNIKDAVKELHKEIYGIPYEPDPFAVSTDTIQLFQKML